MARLPPRIHITGASGSGTTSLGRLIADEYGHRHLDTDDFFWLATSPPYTRQRPSAERLRLLREALDGCDRWVLTGSLVGWGDSLIPEFQLVVYVWTPTDVRLSRLRAREADRYGEASISSGGEQYDASEAFLACASRYDDGGLDVRSRALHEAWLAKLPCPVLRVDGTLPLADNLAKLDEPYA